MKWLELSIEAPGEYAVPLSTIFHRYGTGGAVIDEVGGYNPDEGEGPPPDAPVTIKTYLPLDATTSSRKRSIEVAVRLVALLHPLPPLQERVLQERDWENAWKAHFHVLRVTLRLVIKPSWRSYEPREGDVVIQLDPGLAFGTGYHPTTRTCLRELEATLQPGDRVLDVGTGSGILAIAALKLGARRALALDVDAQAVKAARRNARDNGVGRAVQVVQGTLPYEQPVPPFDLAVANISAAAVIRMAGDLAAALRPGGHLIASGIVQERAEEALAELRQAGFTLLRRTDEALWVSLVASR